jgi:glycosyltransferase involved in cell wall biosynthesis
MSDITIILPFFNEEKYLLDTLNSIKNQTYKNFVCILTNNNSTDNSEIICQDFIQNDKRFIYFKQDTNIGSIANTNFAISHINTPYMMILSGHDIIQEHFIENLLPIIKQNNDISLAFCNYHKIDEQNNITQDVSMKDRYKFEGNPLMRYLLSVRDLFDCTIVQGIFRSNVFDDFSLNSNIPGPDHILLSRLIWKGGLYIVDKYLYKRRFISNHHLSYEQKINPNKTKLKHSLMFETYLDDFDKLYQGSKENKIFLHNKILDILTARFGISHLYDGDDYL